MFNFKIIHHFFHTLITEVTDFARLHFFVLTSKNPISQKIYPFVAVMSMKAAIWNALLAVQNSEPSSHSHTLTVVSLSNFCSCSGPFLCSFLLPPALFHTPFVSLAVSWTIPTGVECPPTAGGRQTWEMNTVWTNFYHLLLQLLWHDSCFQMVSNLHHSSAPSWYSLLLKCNLLRITEHPLEI